MMQNSTEKIENMIQRLKKALVLKKLDQFSPEDYFIMGYVSGANYGTLQYVEKIQNIILNIEKQQSPAQQNGHSLKNGLYNNISTNQTQQSNGFSADSNGNGFTQQIDQLSNRTENLDDSDISFEALNLKQRRLDHEKKKQKSQQQNQNTLQVPQQQYLKKPSPYTNQQNDIATNEDIMNNIQQLDENNNNFEDTHFLQNEQKIQQQDKDFEEIQKVIKKQQELEEQKNNELIQQLLKEDEDRIRQNQENRQKKELEEQLCAICIDELFNNEDLAYMENCEHIYHADCFKEHLKVAIKTRDNSKIICPQDGCKAQVIVDQYQHLLSEQEFKEYQQYSLQNYVDTHGDEYSWCPTADCDYVFVLEDEDAQNNFVCPKCKHHYCLNCRVKYHKGQSCQEYRVTNTRDENDEKFDKYVKGKKLKQCNKCKAIVQKNQGCDHMTCRCGYQFCYKCGGKYGSCECVQKQRERQQEMLRQQQQRRQAAQQRKKSQRGRGRGRGRR